MTVAELAELRGSLLAERVTRAELRPIAPGDRRVVSVDTAAAIADGSGVGREVYALARVLASEGYWRRGSALAHTVAAIVQGQCVANTAAAAKTTILARVTRHRDPELAGRFGSQSGRYVSTAEDPRRWHVAAARAVLRGDLPDLARNGRQFLNPYLQLGGTQAGRALRPLNEVLERWHRTAAWVGPIPGLDTMHLAVFRPEANAARRAKALAALKAELAENTGPHPGDPDGTAPGALVAAAVVAALKFGVLV